MQRQIRRSAFETNSSSNHTLSILKKEIDQFYVKDKLNELTVGGVLYLATTKPQDIIDMTWKDPLYLHKTDLRTKIDLLVYSAIGENSASDFLKMMNEIVKSLEKYVVVNVNYDNLLEASELYTGDGLFLLASSILYNETDIMNFLFSDESYYTCWCDEGCMGPSEETEQIENKMYGRDDVIYIHERL